MNGLLRRLNTTTKLVLFLIGVSILPLLLLGISSYNTSRVVIQDEISEYTLALLIRQEAYLELLLESIESLIENVSGVEEIKKAISDESLADDTYTQLATKAQIGYILNGYLNLEGLVSIDIFTLNGTHYHVGDTLSAENIDEATYQRIYEAALNSDRLVLWTGVEPNINVDSTHKQVITAAKIISIVDAERLQEEPVALFVVTYSTESLYEQFQELDLGEEADVLLIDTQQRLIYHPDPTLIGSTIDAGFVAQLNEDQGSFVSDLDGREVLIAYTRSDVSDWYLVSLVPVASLTASADTIRDVTIWVLLACFGFISLAAVVVTRTTVTPIKQMTAMFKQIQSGHIDADKRLPEQRTDEIGELMRWFNAFLDSLKARQRAEAELWQAKESAEAANAQITVLNDQLQSENEQLETTLQELQATQAELIRTEKLAALGQLIAGVAHEINTPLGAIRASINNTSDILHASLPELPRLLQMLSPEQQAVFSALLERSLATTVMPSAREARKLKRALRAELDAVGVSDPDALADLLLDMGISGDIGSFLPVLTAPNAHYIVQHAYDLAGLQKNGQTITLAVERASKIVFALKHYARYDQHGEKVTAQVTDGIETVLTLYHNQIKHGVEIVRNYNDIPPIHCYPDELNQVWNNLIHNALQAMAYQGELQISTERQNQHILVHITDNGPGIPPEIRERIFEPFFTTKPAGEGSGMGLGIVRKIIERHSGALSVESQPGQTTFTVQLPIKLIEPVTEQGA
ncbi:MAG: HAMP domain-containing protein [Chloroflexaceae bacterium]|nr:HAMP domain-containing protein [Chloroflexaceae bacterium]